MKTLAIAIMLVGLCGCTTIQRSSVDIYGTRTVYTVNSLLNSKTIEGLRFKDCAGCVELSLTNYTSDQDSALQVIKAAIDAYLATKGMQ